jgi:hypothetical protein
MNTAPIADIPLARSLEAEKGCAEPNFKQTDTKAVDVVLHLVLLFRIFALSLWMSIEILLPERISAHVRTTSSASKILEAYEEWTLEIAGWVCQ